MAAIQCLQSTSGKHSPTSSKGSFFAKPFTPISFPSKWYQDAQDPYEGYEDYDLNLDYQSPNKLTIDKHARQIDKSSSQNHYSMSAEQYHVGRICTVPYQTMQLSATVTLVNYFYSQQSNSKSLKNPRPSEDFRTLPLLPIYMAVCNVKNQNLLELFTLITF